MTRFARSTALIATLALVFAAVGCGGAEPADDDLLPFVGGKTDQTLSGYAPLVRCLTGIADHRLARPEYFDGRTIDVLVASFYGKVSGLLPLIQAPRDGASGLWIIAGERAMFWKVSDLSRRTEQSSDRIYTHYDFALAYDTDKDGVKETTYYLTYTPGYVRVEVRQKPTEGRSYPVLSRDNATVVETFDAIANLEDSRELFGASSLSNVRRAAHQLARLPGKKYQAAYFAYLAHLAYNPGTEDAPQTTLEVRQPPKKSDYRAALEYCTGTGDESLEKLVKAEHRLFDSLPEAKAPEADADETGDKHGE